MTIFRPAHDTEGRRLHRGRLTLAALALVATMSTIAIPAGVTQAVSYTIVNTGGVGVRQRYEPKIASGYNGVAPEGATINVSCQTWGDAVGQYGNKLWLKVTRSGYANAFFIADTYTNSPRKATDGPLAGIPMCSTATAPPPAPAPAPTGTYISRAAPLYLCTTTTNAGCRPSGMPSVAVNQTVAMSCWQKGTPYTGDYATDMWFWVNGPGYEGFVSASVVRNQTNVVACTTKPAFVAADVAVARNGQTYASAADQALFSATEWSPGPVGEWAGDCPKLPYVAWKVVGVTVPKRNAIDNYDTWAAAGKIKPGVPPRGALVFYNKTTSNPYGHTAVSLGQGFMATTNGFDKSGQANSTRAYTSSTSYLGWAMPG